MGSYNARLTIEERNLLSVAYKNMTNNLRNSWRIVDTLEQMQRIRDGDKRHLELTRIQRGRIETDLTNLCKEIVSLLEQKLIPAAKRGEESVFYSKMSAPFIFPYG